MKTAEHQILTRISFAERWLQRAREECLDGDVGRGLLTLVLADAEVRRLLQLAVPPAPRARWLRLPVVAGIAGLVIAAAMALQLGVPALRAASMEPAALAPSLSLRPGTGALLLPLEADRLEEVVAAVRAAPPAVSPLPVRVAPAPARPVPGSVTQRPTGAPASITVRAPQPAAPRLVASSPTVQTATPAPVPAAVPTVTPVPAPNATLSVADLLDLVIVADRTLRRSEP